MMNIDLIRTIALFFAAGGLICIGLWMGKKGLFYRKMKISISQASLRAGDGPFFDCQIDLDIDTKGEDVCLEELMFSHPVWQIKPDTGENTYPVDRLVRHPGYCVLDERIGLFPEKVRALAEQSFKTAGFTLSSGKYRCVSMIERIVMAPNEDSAVQGWPLEGWTLTVCTSGRKIQIPFVFHIHESSDMAAFCRNYVKPPVSFVCG